MKMCLPAWFRCCGMSMFLVTCVSCATHLDPQPALITDGQGADYYRCPKFEKKIVDEGRGGCLKVLRTVRNGPSRDVLGVCLRCLAAFNDSYERIGVECADESGEISEVLISLLRSSNRSDVAACVTALYYDFDEYCDDDVLQRLGQLRSSDDVYIRKFSALSRARMRVTLGLPPE